MSFATWLKHQRESRSLSLRGFAEQVGVDVNVISRVEKEEFEATLSTAVRICQGLGISLIELFQDIYGEIPAGILTTPIAPDRNRALQLNDVRSFQKWFYLKPLDGALSYLAYELSYAAFKGSQLMGKNAQLPPVTEDALGPFFWTNPVVRKAEVVYPEDLFDDQRVIATYRKGGVLLFSEAGVVIKAERRKREETIADLSKRVRLSTASLSRLESGIIERILLNDLFRLDKALGMGGLLLALYWVSESFHASAAAFRDIRREEGITGFGHIDELELAQLLVTLGRWREIIDANFDWLEALRNKINSPLDDPRPGRE